MLRPEFTKVVKESIEKQGFCEVSSAEVFNQFGKKTDIYAGLNGFCENHGLTYTPLPGGGSQVTTSVIFRKASALAETDMSTEDLKGEALRAIVEETEKLFRRDDIPADVAEKIQLIHSIARYEHDVRSDQEQGAPLDTP